ncbi:hypothetical protein D3C85_1556420 [compost metagenome]
MERIFHLRQTTNQINDTLMDLARDLHLMVMPLQICPVDMLTYPILGFRSFNYSGFQHQTDFVLQFGCRFKHLQINVCSIQGRSLYSSSGT